MRSKNTTRIGASGPYIIHLDLEWPAAASIPDQGQDSRNFAVPNLQVGDLPVVAPDPGPVGLVWQAQRCVIEGTLTVQVSNVTTNPIDPVGTVFAVRVL